MANSRNITDTNARVFQALGSVAQNVYDKQNVETKIEKAVTDSMITTGHIIKFYPYLNKCQVQLDINNKIVLCSVTSLFGGDLLSLYTPTGEESYCETLKEPCVIPRGRLNVLVAKINNENYDYVMLGYFLPDDLIEFSPSAPSQFKMIAFGGVNEYSVKFGIDGLKIVNNGEIDLTSLDDLEGDVTVEYYNKEEIDEKLEDYQPLLESGVNIKTINNQSILGSGNINIQGGGGGDLSDYVKKSDLLDKTKYDIDLNLSFGLKGQDDSIVIDMDIVDHVVNKEINLRGV